MTTCSGDVIKFKRSSMVPDRATRLAMLREALEDANSELRSELFHFNGKAFDKLPAHAVIRVDAAIARYMAEWVRGGV